MIKVSAIICTFNRADFLRACIESVFAQDLPKDQFELIVVDNASTDGTAALLDELCLQFDIVRVYEPVQGLSRARNAGWAKAKGQYIGFLDDDAKADSCWLRMVVDGFENLKPEPSSLTGPIALFGEALPPWIEGDLKTPLGYMHWGDVPRRMTFHEKTIMGGNCFFTREILEETGGFCEELGRKKNNLLSGEEVHLQKSIEERGGAVWYHPGVSIVHYVGPERIKPKWFYRRYYWGGVSDCIMARQKAAETIGSNQGIKADAGEQRAEPRLAQLNRLLTNVAFSLGLIGDANKTIQSRIYMSYVWGYVRTALFFRHTR